VRKAIAYGIDFATIGSTIIGIAGDPSTSLPGSEGMFAINHDKIKDYLDNTAPKYAYDPEMAKSLLAEAGYADGFELSLMTNENTLRASICVAIQEQLAQIGVTVNINKVDGASHTAYQFGQILGDDGLRGYDILMAGWSADFPDLNGNLTPLFLTGQTANAAAYSNTALDELIKAQSSEEDPEKRTDLILQCFDIITEEVPYLYVYYPIKAYAYTNKITGIDEKVNWVSNPHFQDAKPVQ